MLLRQCRRRCGGVVRRWGAGCGEPGCARAVRPGRRGRTGSLAEQPLDPLDVGGRGDDVLGQPARLARGLLLELVDVVGLLAHDLALAGDAEPLLGAAVGLHLRHGSRSPRRLVRPVGADRRPPRSSLVGGHGASIGWPRPCGRDRTASAPSGGGREGLSGLGLGRYRRVGGCGRRGARTLGVDAAPAALLGLGLGLLLRRTQNHDHVAAVLLRRALDEAQLGDVLGEALQQPESQLRPGLLASAEHDGDLDLVTGLEEPDDVALLGAVVVRVDLRPELDLLDHRVDLVLAGLTGLQRVLVLELAEVHELAYRRPSRRRPLDQVEVGLLGQPERVLDAHDADLLTIGSDEPHLGYPDAVVDARFADVLLLRVSPGPRRRERLPSPSRGSLLRYPIAPWRRQTPGGAGVPQHARPGHEGRTDRDLAAARPRRWERLRLRTGPDCTPGGADGSGRSVCKGISMDDDTA